MGGPRPSYSPPPPPAPAPVAVAEASAAPGDAKSREDAKRRRVAGQMGGRESTILTSGLGVTAGNQTLGS
jgi:hypothetical protein